jgi:hypothetical protein
MTDKPPKPTITEASDSTGSWPRFLVTAPPGYRFGVNLYSMVINGTRADAERFVELHPCTPDSESTDTEITLDIEPPRPQPQVVRRIGHSFVDWNDPDLARELEPLGEVELLKIDQCRRCTECEGQEHHWMENDEVYSENDPWFMCKHCEAVCDGVDTPEGDVVPSGIARPSRRADPKIATKIRDLPSPGRAALYRCDPPLNGETFVVASSADGGDGPEVLLLPATEHGEVASYSDELDGSYAGGHDHVEAFTRAGYRIATNKPTN